ncbi:MAG: MerR family transcriptional regulator [Oscillospiraceae bacterium]
MFKIGEFSKLTQVSIRMLRYYDETGLLKPEKTDRFTGYRLYSAAQIPLLNKIVFLRDVGFTVAEMAAALPHWGSETLVARLEHKRLEIEQAIETEQHKLYKINLAKKDIPQPEAALHYSISIKPVPACRVLSLRRTVCNYYAEGQLWKELAAFAGENNIPISSNTFTIYHDTEYRETQVDIEVCAPVARPVESRHGFTCRQTRAVAAMAFTMVYGPFANIAGAYLAFAGWLQAHSRYKMSGQSRQIVHRGPWNEESPAQYLTELQIPLKKP